MTSLQSIAQDVDSGDYLAWLGEHSIDEVERVYPKRVTNVSKEGDSLTIEAEGVRGGEYFLEVTAPVQGKAYFVNPRQDEPVYQGPVVFAERTTSADPVRVKEGYYDRR